MPALVLNEVFESVVHQAQGKFIYERAAVETGNARVKQALDLLEMAGLIIPVTHSSANGIPLGAEINPKNRRIIPCDTGFFLHILGIDKSEIMRADSCISGAGKRRKAAPRSTILSSAVPRSFPLK